MDEVAAKRYAKAIFEVALEKRSVEKLKGELLDFKGLFESGGVDFLKNPVFSQKEKETVIEEVSDKKRYSQEMKNFLRLLIHEKRIEDVPAISKDYADLLMEHLGIETAEVYSAVELTKAQIKKLGEALSKVRGKKIEIRNIIDGSVIGGIKVRIGGFLYDGSVRNMLERFKSF